MSTADTSRAQRPKPEKSEQVEVVQVAQAVSKDAAKSRAKAALRPTSLAQLPKINQRQKRAPQWLEIIGLNAQTVRGKAAVSGQPTLLLTSLPDSEIRRIGVRFKGAVKGRVHRATVWVKPGTENSILLNIVDDPRTNVAVVAYDLAERRITQQHEQVVDRGINERNGWLRVWADFKPESSDVLVQLALYGFEPPADLTLGGVTLEPLK